MSVLWAVGIFFLLLQLLGPSFFRLISKKEAPLSLPRAFDTSKKSNIFRREREQFSFSTRKRHETRPFSLSLSCSSSLKIALSHNRYRLLDRAGDHPMRRSFALFERGRRSSSSRSTTTRESKRERKRGKKKKTFGSDARDEGVQKLVSQTHFLLFHEIFRSA